MDLLVARRWPGPKDTIGELMVNGEFFCNTMEDVLRKPGVKIPGKTAIPPGEYPLVLDFSPKFSPAWGKIVGGSNILIPHVRQVPGFSEIRIHWGTTAENTEGCLLVGLDKNLTARTITRSRDAFRKLLPLLMKAVAHNERMAIHFGPAGAWQSVRPVA